MRELEGDLFELAREDDAWMVVTTNGCVRANGALVMGAGVAGAARDTFAGLDARLGDAVTRHGNVPVALEDLRIATWPTKPASHTVAEGDTHPGWQCMARVKGPECHSEVARLTAASGEALIELVDSLELKGPIYLPRPGCGLGGLDWARVQPWMAERFDERFVVVSLPLQRP